MKWRMLPLILIALAVTASVSETATVEQVEVRGFSENYWRGYARGEAFVAQGNIVIGLLGYSVDATSPYSVWASAVGDLPVGRRGEEKAFDELRTRLAVEWRPEGNLEPFVAAAFTGYQSRDGALWDHRAGEFSLAAGLKKSGEPLLPTHVTFGFDHLFMETPGDYFHVDLLQQVSSGSQTGIMQLKLGWADYPPRGLREGVWVFEDVRAEVALEQQFGPALATRAGLFGVRGFHEGRSKGGLGVYVAMRFRVSLARAFKP